MDVAVLERFRTLYPQAPGLEGAQAGSKNDAAGIEFCAGRGFQREAAVFELLQAGYHLAEVKLRVERLDLLHQPVHQLLCTAHRNGRDVVNGFIRVELGALAAGLGQGIHHVGMDVQQSQFKNLEQAGGAGADDDYVGLDAHVTPMEFSANGIIFLRVSGSRRIVAFWGYSLQIQACRTNHP